MEHSDPGGRVSKLQKMKHTIINAFYESDVPILTIEVKPRPIRIPISKPLSLYAKRIASHGQLGFTLHKFKMNPWDRSYKVLQVHITTENKDALERLCGSIVQSLGGLASGGRALQPSTVGNSLKVSPVRRKSTVADGYSNRPRNDEDLPQLSEEQRQVFDLVVTKKKSIFFTGSAGTGKSLLLKHIVRALPVSSTAVTVTTGLSGSLLGGSTIHAFAGVGRGDGDIDVILRYARRPDTAFRWRQLSTLIIDEISMMDGTFFDVLELVARKIRGTSRPFGGIQLVICGDFHQLPPVAKKGPSTRTFCFESRAWASCIHHCIELKHVFRQSDLYFVDVLGEVRRGALSHVDLLDKLSTCCRPLNVEDGILPTKIFTHRVDVDSINTKELESLSGSSSVYHARDSGDASILDSSCPAPRVVHLKVGAQVMLTRNISSRKGLVNGSRGVVEKISSTGLPYVRFASQTSDESVLIQRELWNIHVGSRVVATMTQVPLVLAYAITVHKSQGMSLDKVEISLERAFETGMAYVALSRAKTMEGLRICGSVAQESLRADPKVLAFYQSTEFF